MDILIDTRCCESIDVEKSEHLASFVLSREHAPEDLELSISYVDTDEIHKLNATYRGIDAPTDVLSFECDDIAENAEMQLKTLFLGDVIICPAIARKHAHDFDSTVEHEMALLLTHGILHLLGYDHIEDEEATVMEARENTLLAEWFANTK